MQLETRQEHSIGLRLDLAMPHWLLPTSTALCLRLDNGAPSFFLSCQETSFRASEVGASLFGYSGTDWNVRYL